LSSKIDTLLGYEGFTGTTPLRSALQTTLIGGLAAAFGNARAISLLTGLRAK